MNEFIFATLGLQAFPCGKSGARCLIIWAFPHIYVRSGYILAVIVIASLAANLLKRSLAAFAHSASLRPKGSLSLTQMLGKYQDYFCQINPQLNRLFLSRSLFLRVFLFLQKNHCRIDTKYQQNILWRSSPYGIEISLFLSFFLMR